MIAPPRWTDEQLKEGIEAATAIFRRQRMREPLQLYLDAFARYEGFADRLLAASADLAELDREAVAILIDPNLLEVLRYSTGPPLSADDLETLSESLLSPTRLRQDPSMVHRIVEIISMGLDRRRFPWVSENRAPTAQERAAAVLASATLMAAQRVGTTRRQEGKEAQELMVAATLSEAGMQNVAPRPIATLNRAPSVGEFCRESVLGSRKADIVVRLWDHRIMPIECKVFNSALNSIKQINNDAAVKAETWTKDFGTRNIVPTAVIGGVYKLRHLSDAQQARTNAFLGA